jgi:hypothetical protein
VAVSVVNVRKVRMAVGQDGVAVRMHMRLTAIPRKVVFMPMMLFMRMAMAMLQHIVRVLMLMALADVQPHAQAHQPGGNPEQG